MNEHEAQPFHLRVGMVLQRNWKQGLESPISAFSALGEYLIVKHIREDSSYIEMNFRDRPYLSVGYPRIKITAEWFIPD